MLNNANTGLYTADLTFTSLSSVSFFQVVSGTDRGNMLLWDGNAIKVEICQKEGRSCHAGVVQPFSLEDGQLMTIGSDGVVRVIRLFHASA